jgi:hypothetical protein
MCIDPSQLHFSQQSLQAHASLQRDFIQDRLQGPDLERFVIRNRDGMNPGRLTAPDHVAASLPLKDITDALQSSQQIIASKVTRQFHAASKMRSSSSCRRMRPGLRVASAKWQRTASLAIASSSSQESPWVTIKPSGSRQSAVKPPSSAGRTRKTSSRSFIQ